MSVIPTKYNTLFLKSDQIDTDFVNLISEDQLEEFEKETLKYLYKYFQSGNFIFVKEIFSQAKIPIKNTDSNFEELIEISYIKFLSLQGSLFENFFYKWIKKIIINSVDNPLILNNHIEGKILWKETFRERNYLDYPKSVKFVCSSYKNNFDSLENIVMKSFLVDLKNLFDKYDKYFEFNKEIEKKKKVKDWKFNAHLIHNILKKILRNHYMVEITYKKKIWTKKNLLIQSIRSCHKNNRFILLQANLFNDLILGKNLDLLKNFLLQYVLKPNRDKTAELFVLFSLINNISSKIEGDEKYYLISPTSKKKYVFKKKTNENKNIRIYYQKLPKDISIKYPDTSMFSETIKHYDFKQGSFHPDITIEEKTNGTITKLLFFEVKNSSDKNYIRKGLQQICNYHDYSNYLKEPYPKEKKAGYLIVKSIPVEWKGNYDDKNFYIRIIDFNNLDSLTLF